METSLRISARYVDLSHLGSEAKRHAGRKNYPRVRRINLLNSRSSRFCLRDSFFHVPRANFINFCLTVL